MACNSTAASGCATTPELALRPGFDAAAAQLHLTDAVVDKVAALLAEEGDSALALRIYVTGGGCSGFQYGFAFDETEKDDDLRFTRGPVSVLVDALSLQYLSGAEIDFEDSLEGARFVIRNPNAASTCGCGSSFSV